MRAAPTLPSCRTFARRGRTSAATGSSICCWTKNERRITRQRHALGSRVMQLGFVSAILPDLSLEQVLDFARQEGFGCVELMCWPVGSADRRYAGVTHLDVASLDAGKAR